MSRQILCPPDHFPRKSWRPRHPHTNGARQWPCDWGQGGPAFQRVHAARPDLPDRWHPPGPGVRLGRLYLVNRLVPPDLSHPLDPEARLALLCLVNQPARPDPSDPAVRLDLLYLARRLARSNLGAPRVPPRPEVRPAPQAPPVQLGRPCPKRRSGSPIVSNYWLLSAGN